jgi:glucose/arabinose dehydrogenase/mono/diheme cytochrome c family protein
VAQTMKKIGFGATVLLLVLLSFNMLREPFRQHETLTVEQRAAISRATGLYAQNCVGCHGAFGEGLAETLPLNTRDVRNKTADELFKTIARGRLNTAMAAFGIDEGGALTTPQIDDLVTLIKYGSWRDVQSYVAAHGLTPTDLPPIDQQFDIAALSYPLDVVSLGRDVYLANCFTCHNPSSTGRAAHDIGKDLVDNEFIQTSTDQELIDFIKKGRLATDPANVTGNEMPARGGNPNLSDEDIAAAVAYLRELNNGTAVLPTIIEKDLNPPGTWDGVTYQWIKIADNFDSPLGLVNAGDGSNRLFVLEQTGFIWIIKDGKVLPEPFMDVTDLLPLRVYEGIYTEQGLLGLAFHPDFAENGIFFINYSNHDGDSVVARYHVMPDNPDRADPATGEIILTVDQPFEDHNGGDLVFGPDGYLYIGFGDGGRPSQPNYNSQDPKQYLGKMLRIDVNADPYAIPPDNPFVGNPDYLPEIWALGLRNPWRYTFDRLTGDLYIGDVGQWHIEELDVQPADSKGGENYGWSAYEGTEVYLEDETVLGGEMTPPVLQHIHDEGQSITGGYVYRGQELPGLWGLYIYGDYITGAVWLAYPDDTGVWQTPLLMDTSLVISSFGEDEQGEIYLVDYKGGIYRLEIVETPEVTPTLKAPAETPAQAPPGETHDGASPTSTVETP